VIVVLVLVLALLTLFFFLTGADFWLHVQDGRSSRPRRRCRRARRMGRSSLTVRGQRSAIRSWF